MLAAPCARATLSLERPTARSAGQRASLGLGLLVLKLAKAQVDQDRLAALPDSRSQQCCDPCFTGEETGSAGEAICP